MTTGALSETEAVLPAAEEAALPREQPPRPGFDILVGVVTGQVAGLLMAAALSAAFSLSGRGVPFPLQLVGSLAWGEGALQGFDPRALLTGLALHQAGPSLLWGALMGALVYLSRARDSFEAVCLGIVLGVVSQIVDVDVVLPYVFTAFQGRDLWTENVPEPWSWAAHLVFGFGLGLYPRVYRRLARRG